MNIAAILEEQAARAGSRAAIVEPGRTISFAALDHAAAATAADLAAQGLHAGMRAVIVSPMSIALYTTMIALFRLRATAVFVDPSAGWRRLDACIARVRPDAFLAVPRAHWLRVISPAVRAIRWKAALSGTVPFTARVGVSDSGRHPVEPCAPGTPAIITFTSGSTGAPKAAVRTHGFLVAQHRALAASLDLRAGEVDLCTLPIFVLANLASGVTSVIPDADLRRPGAIDPGRLRTQIDAAAPTRVVASPALFDRLAAHAGAERRPLATFRKVYTGGAPVFPWTLDAIAAAAPHASVVAVYGSTEAEPIAEIDRHEITAEDRDAMVGGRGLLVGRPTPSLELKILADRWGAPLGPWTAGDLARAALPDGNAGEIVVSGDHVLPGYLDGLGDDETKIDVEGRIWHRTGDAGSLDASGRLWLLGRCAARVDDDAGVLYPFAVECAAGVVPGVTRTAFVAHRGRRILIVQSTAADPHHVRAALMDRLRWAALDDLTFIRAIPLDHRHNAKVDYEALRRMLGTGARGARGG